MIDVLNSSTRTRALVLSFGYAFALGASALAVCAFAYFKVKEWNIQEVDKALYNLQVEAGKGTKGLESAYWKITQDDEAKLFPFHLGSALVDIRTLDGRIILNSRSLKNSELPVDPGALAEAAKKNSAFRWITWKGVPHRMISAKLGETTSAQPVLMSIAVPLENMNYSNSLWGFALVPVLLFAAFAAGIHAGSTWNRRERTAY